ncbi:MAG: Rrf2 family transcriptional regulator [Phycisphaerales bacterium]|nr:MAG: Rrf2 family transcriptional regulator [Phycisphaerales bacterium]
MRLNLDFIMAVRAVQFLQKRKTNDYVQAEEIAGELGFCTGYLQRVMQTLSKHGMVESKRGITGGTRLGKKKITLLDLWTFTCGRIDLADPPVPELKKPMKALADAMSKVVMWE